MWVSYLLVSDLSSNRLIIDEEFYSLLRFCLPSLISCSPPRNYGDQSLGFITILNDVFKISRFTCRVGFWERTVFAVRRYIRLKTFSVPVSGNFTDEEAENRVEFPLEESGLSKGYPLQRDDVQTTPSRDDHKQYVGKFID